MYPSNNTINVNSTNIFNSYTNLDHTTLVEPYNINNPNSKQEDHSLSSFLYQLPSPCNPYEDDAVLLQFLHEYQQQHPPPPYHHLHQEVEDPIEAITTQEDQRMPFMVDFNTKDEMVKKKTSKKDRHSKIHTAQGPRDRRMRLSLEVAREFFDLQDILGFDKASKTVEWLLIKSRDAIKELTRDPMKESFISFGANSASSTSECEVVSGPVRVDTEKPSPVSVKPKKVREPRKPAFLPRNKESREKARERARERAKAKRRLADARLPLEAINSNPNLDLGDVDQEMMFSYDHSNNGVSQEHQFTDYQVYGKPWEAYTT